MGTAQQEVTLFKGIIGPTSKFVSLKRQTTKALDRDPPSVSACRSEKQQREERWRVGYREWKEQHGYSDDTKVFVICPPRSYIDVRETLEGRGWVENTDTESEFFDFKYTIRAKDLKNPPPLDHQQLNHYFGGGCLTTKTGITSCIRQLPWHHGLHQDDIMPRSYNLGNPSDREAWEIDFKWTASEAILRRVQIDRGLHPAGIPEAEDRALECAIKVVKARLAHMTYLQENDSEELEAPCLPPDMNEEDWRAILGCSYFDLKLSDEENISKEEEPVVDTNDDDDSDADVDGVIDDDGEMGGAVDAVAGGSCNNDQSRNQITGEDAAGRPEANQGVAGSDPKSTAHGPPAIQGSDSGDQDSFQIESSPRSCTRGAMAWESKQAGRETEGQETQAARQERFKNVKAIELDPYTKQLVDYLLSELAARCRQFKINGCANVWILKPGGKSRGRGIRCINKLSAVHQLLHNSNTRRRVGLPPSMWVVQKYIENPLVVHRRKFDIRQWVMVTDWNPLTVWFYDACYVRFAAEDYSLANFENRFSHLTNNSIASKSDQFEQEELGEGNMWDSDEFKRWLAESYNQPDAFTDKIQPAMRRSVECSLATCQDIIQHRKASHELFGYDFIVDEDLNTWLIEVNCSPCLAHSTPVTGRLVSGMVNDMMKVLIDLPEARRQARRGEFNTDEFDTGLWKRTGRALPQTSVKQPHIMGVALQTQGSAMKIRRRRAKSFADTEAASPERDDEKKTRLTLATDRPASTSSRDESPNFHHEKAQRTPAVSTTPDDFVGKEPEADFSEAAKQNLLMGTRRSDRSDDQTDQCTSPVLSSRRSLASLSESSLPLGHLRRQASERRTNTQGSLFRVDDASMESAGAPAVHSSSSSSSPSRPSGPSFFYAVLPNLNNHPCQVQSSGVDSTPSSAPPERHRVLKPVSAALRMFPPAPSPRVTMMGNKHPGARHHTASGKGSSDDRHWRVTLEETPFQQKSDAQNTSSVGTRGIRSSLGSSYFTRLWGDVKPAGEGCGVSQCSTTSESGAGPDGKQQMQPGNRSMKITCRAKCLKGECSSSDEALNKLLERHRGMLEAAKEESRRALRDLLARSERCPTFPTRRITFEDSENSDTEFLTREQNGFYPGSASTAPRGPGMASTRLPAAKASSRHMGHVNSSLSSQEMQVFLRERKGLAQMGFDHNAEDNLLTAAAVLRHPAGRAHIEPGGRLQTLPRRKRQQQSDARAGRASAYGSSRLARADLPRSSAFSALPSPTALMSAAQGHALATDLRSSW